MAVSFPTGKRGLPRVDPNSVHGMTSVKDADQAFRKKFTNVGIDVSNQQCLVEVVKLCVFFLELS
jgi:hypothetical protein